MLWSQKNQKQRAVDLSGAPVKIVESRRSAPLVLVLSILLLTAVGVAGYFYWQFRNAQPGVVEMKEIDTLVEILGTMMVLPEGETPTLATVTDKEKLVDRPFFQNAENGDKVLIYSGSGRAILYRPSSKKIVDVTPVNVSDPTASLPPAEASTQKESAPVPKAIRMALLNGSNSAGAATSLEARLNQDFTNVVVTSKENAKKQDYAETTVVDLTGSNTVVAAEIAETLDATVGSLPAGETTPSDSDILIIIGKAR